MIMIMTYNYKLFIDFNLLVMFGTQWRIHLKCLRLYPRAKTWRPRLRRPKTTNSVNLVQGIAAFLFGASACEHPVPNSYLLKILSFFLSFFIYVSANSVLFFFVFFVLNKQKSWKKGEGESFKRQFRRNIGRSGAG